MTQKPILLALALASYLLPNSVYAHAEHDKARFVATNGVDQGNCDSPVRPCKSISYAVSRAAKGDKVLVASGDYTITNESEVFYLKSQLVPVMGGFNRFDHFQVQSPDVNQTTIIGAPKELHESLNQAGFKVIADGKSLSISAKLKTKFARNQALSQIQSNQACENGQAGAFSCNNIDLVSHIPLPSGTEGSDVWGHVDLNTGTEYAIMTYRDGTRVYSLADPTSPQLVGHIQGNDTSWRDIKVLQYFDENLAAYQAYAYVTMEFGRGSLTNGIQIIDLNNLPQSVELLSTDTSVATAHNVYISNVDYSLNLPMSDLSPKLQIVGANRFGGAFMTYDLSTPSAPSLTYNPSSSFRSNYTHDATSMTVDDERATRDCVNSNNGTCDVFIDFNENEIRIWDATNTENTANLGSVSYDDVASSDQYVHSGWWHENKRHVYVQDEFDENSGGLNTTVRILDLIDLTNPVVVGKWESDNRTIDHNGFVKGNRYYMSNYERGLTVLDISDPVNPVEVGYFDTFPSSNNASFNGAWGAYPYLPSGNILISDINSGLYVVRDNSRDNLAQVNFDLANQLVDRGTEVTLLINKPIAINQAASVHFDIVDGSASLGADFTISNANQELTWNAEDTEPKAITLNVLDNGEDTSKNFFVKLHNASGNLQIGDQFIQQVNINGLPSQGRVGFVNSELVVSETNGQIELNIQRIGGSRGALTYDYQVNYGSATADDITFNNGTVTWQDGDADNKTLSFSIIDDDLMEQAETFSIVLTNGEVDLLSIDTINITISDNDSNTAPEVYAGNDIELSTNATATLTAATVTDAENDPLTYLWQHVSGVTITLSDEDTLTPRATASGTAGTAVVSLTATDVHGASNTSELTITVVAPPPPTETSSGGSSGGSMPIWLLTLISLFAFRKRNE